MVFDTFLHNCSVKSFSLFFLTKNYIIVFYDLMTTPGHKTIIEKHAEFRVLLS